MWFTTTVVDVHVSPHRRTYQIAQMVAPSSRDENLRPSNSTLPPPGHQLPIVDIDPWRVSCACPELELVEANLKRGGSQTQRKCAEITTSLASKADKRFQKWIYISGSPAFAKVEWLLFVAMNVRSFVNDLPRLNNFHATEALGS
jgi:hypothetical protein